jgi:nitronate monooxygenase
MSLWAGQAAALIRHDSAAEVLAELLAGSPVSAKGAPEHR